MTDILEQLYQFKFTLIYSVGFFILGGLLLGAPAIFCGLMVDWCINHAPKKSSYTKEGQKILGVGDCMGYWLAYAAVMGFGYSYLVLSNYNDGGMIYQWLRLTRPFTAEMASHIPFIEIRPKQIAEIAGAWHEPVMRHLYAVFWFTSIIALPLLFAGFKHTIYDWHIEMLKEIDEEKKSVFWFNCKMLIIFLLGVLFSYVAIEDAYLAKWEFSKSLYHKKYYIVEPIWILGVFTFITDSIVNAYLVNKELIRRKIRG